MPIRYDKLFALMKENGLTTYRIRKERVITETTLQKLREGRSVTTDSIEKLCRALRCQPGDIMEYVEDSAGAGSSPQADRERSAINE